MPFTLDDQKQRLLRAIDELEKNPDDRVRILGDAGITVLGAGLGVAAAGTIAAAAGATSTAGITTAASWLGLTVVAATPVGWIIGCGALAGAAGYGVTRMISNGSRAEATKHELAVKFREQVKALEAKENTQKITDSDRTAFLMLLRVPVKENLLAPDTAFRLIEQVERGGILLSVAVELVQKLLEGTPRQQAMQNLDDAERKERVLKTQGLRS